MVFTGCETLEELLDWARETFETTLGLLVVLASFCDALESLECDLAFARLALVGEDSAGGLSYPLLFERNEVVGA